MPGIFNEHLKHSKFPLRLTVFAGISLALVAYFVGAWHSPLLDRELKLRFDAFTQAKAWNEEEERSLAKAYWNRYADVAADSYYGRKGTLGVWGAREHFNYHGKREGRHWPEGTLQKPRVIEN